MGLPVLFNFIRRQKFLMILLLIIFVVMLAIRHITQNKYGPRVNFATTVESYCNAPHEVDGQEREKATGLILRQVQVLIRHGDRAPVDLRALPNTSPVHISCRFNSTNIDFRKKLEKYKDVIAKNAFKVKGSEHLSLLEERNICHSGQLTPFGMLQHLYLGSHFRQVYSSFVDTINVPNDVHIITTDLPRTKQSAAALVTGMLYDKLVEKSDVGIPINVHKDHIMDSHLVLDEHEKPLKCDMLTKKWKELLAGPKFKQFHSNTQRMTEAIASYLSIDVDQLPQFNRIVDTFYARSCHGLGLPAGPKYKLPTSLVEQAFGFSNLYSTLRHSGDLAELQALSLLSQIARHSVLALKKEKEAKKIVLYSGHDSMIHPFVQMMDEKFNIWPPYASRIVFEFYVDHMIEDNDVDILHKSFFRVLYNGQALKSIKFLSPPEGPLRLYSLSSLFRFLSNGFTNFGKYESGILGGILFGRIQTLCE